MRRLAALLLLGFASCVHAQESPAEVTDGEIAKYKKLAYAECRQPGLARGDPEARVDALCGCVIASLEKTMKRPEWQQASFYRMKSNADLEKQVLAPHVQNLKHCSQKPAPAK